MYIIFYNKNHIFFRWKLVFYIIVSLIILIIDIEYNIFFKIQNYINCTSLLLNYLNETSKKWMKSTICSFNNNQKLVLENQMLQKKLFITNNRLLLTEYYKQENKKLHKLLLSSPYCYKKKILAQVISNKINPYNSQVIIDKGINHGVRIGQTAVNEKGIIGQVITTNKFTSQILLICDIAHALPVQILRNNNRMILKGNGYNKYLELKNLSNNHDIKIGDVLITSGLDGRFPQGYPVAIVSSIITNHKNRTNKIQAYSIAKLNHLSYLLLLENIEHHN